MESNFNGGVKTVNLCVYIGPLSIADCARFLIEVAGRLGVGYKNNVGVTVGSASFRLLRYMYVDSAEVVY